MTRKTHVILQLAATFLHPVSLAFPLEAVDPVWRPFVHTSMNAGLGVLQLLLANQAHKFNPDGTPAEVAYVPPQKDSSDSK